MNETKEMNRVNCTNQLDWSGKTILMVMNDPHAAYLINEFFNETNAGFIHAPYHKSLVTFQDVDLIIIDISLKEIRTDFELTRTIKQRYPGIPVIANSASVFKHEIEACYRAGCDECIPKPTDFDYLATVLVNYLGR